jgi:hypothetical protein
MLAQSTAFSGMAVPDIEAAKRFSRTSMRSRVPCRERGGWTPTRLVPRRPAATAGRVM